MDIKNLFYCVSICQAGLVSLDRQISLLEYRDSWPEVEQLLVKAKPAWPPGDVRMRQVSAHECRRFQMGMGVFVCVVWAVTC